MTIEQFSKIYDQNFKKIYRFFYYKTNSIQDAEDMTSDVFLAFSENINKDEIKNYTAFLYGIAKNIFYKYIREKQYTITVDWETFDFYQYVENTSQNKSQSPDFQKRIVNCIAQLPEKQRVIAELRFIQKLSLTEIAIKLNKTMSYVKTTQNRAIKKLKSIVKNEKRKT